MFGLLCGVLLAGSATSMVAAQDTVRLVVVATTDVHGRVYHWDYVRDEEAAWGLTRAATVVDSLRATYPGHVIVVDAGDLIQGNPFAAFFAAVRPAAVNPVIDALNAVRYDAATPGNHEFNWGVDVFASAVEAAAFPVVSANLYRLPRDTLAFPPFVTLVRDGIRVGITGFTTPGAMVWDAANLAGRLRVRSIPQEAQRVLDRMHASQMDLRIALIHSGMDGPSSYNVEGVGGENVAAELARLPHKPDLVVVGHTHRTMADSVIAGVHFIQAPPHARGLAVAHVWLVKRNDGLAGARSTDGRDPSSGRSAYDVVRIEGETIALANVAPHPVITRGLAGAHDAVRSWVSKPLARVVDGDWSAWYARAEDTPIIDFVNAVQRRVAGTQLSATAAFDTRAVLGPGEVRLRDVAGLYPYENSLTAVTIDGASLLRYLEQSAAYFRTYQWGEPIINDSVPGFNFDIVSGLDYVLDLSQPVGSRVKRLSFEGQPVQPTDSFTLALNNYRRGGGGGFTMLNGLPLIFDGGDIRDLLVEHIRTVRYLRASDYFEPSWRIVPDAAAAAVRAAFGSPPGLAAAPDPARPGRDTIIPLDPGRHMPYEVPRQPAPPLAVIKVPLERSDAENGLGRLIADAYRAGARTHVAIVPNERIAAGLPSGPVSSDHIDAVLPDAGALVRVVLSGRHLRQLLEHAVSEGPPVVHVSGVLVVYAPERPPNRRIRRLRFPDGTDVHDGDRYEVAVPTALVQAGGGVAIPTAAGTQVVVRDVEGGATGLSEAEALATYLRVLHQPVEAPPSARFRIER